MLLPALFELPRIHATGRGGTRRAPLGTRVNFPTTLALVMSLLPPLAGAQALQSLEAIRAAARDFAWAQLAARYSDLEIEAGPLDARLRLPACAQRLEAFLAPGAKLAGRTTVGVRCTGSEAWSLYVPLQVRAYGKVVTARQALARGQVLTEADVALERRDLFALPGTPLTELSRTLGQTLRQAVAAGTVLQPTMLEPRKLVRRGEPVTIVAEAAMVQVRTNGVVLADGAAGERVAVRNALTRKVIQATVAAPGLVRIEMVNGR